MKNIPSALRFRTRDQWRSWLRKNRASSPGVWLSFFKKGAAKKGLAYDEAVEEALCFGWIDSVLRRIDDERHVIRFTPRRPGSVWAPSNIARVKRLIQAGRMTKAGLALFKSADLRNRTAPAATRPGSLTLPRDLRAALKANERAERHFSDYPPSFRRTAIWWVRSAKREATRRRRIEDIVRNAAQHARPSY